MKILLIGESREKKLLESTYELVGFAGAAGAESALFLVGNASDLPLFNGRLYLADANVCADYNPDLHKELILKVVAEDVERETMRMIDEAK